MNQHLIGGVIVAAIAILVGAGWLFGAILSRRHRAEFAPTYGEAGGIVYTVAQIGCASVLVLGGVLILVLAMISQR